MLHSPLWIPPPRLQTCCLYLRCSSTYSQCHHHHLVPAMQWGCCLLWDLRGPWAAFLWGEAQRLDIYWSSAVDTVERGRKRHHREEGGLIVSLGDRQRKPVPLSCWALACESWRTAKGYGSTFSGAGVGHGGDVLARGGAEGQRREVAHIPGLQRNLAKSHWWLQPRVAAYTGEGAPGQCSPVGLSAMVGMSYSFLTLMFKHSRCAQCY